jgi:hypothetical protein
MRSNSGPPEEAIRQVFGDRFSYDSKRLHVVAAEEMEILSSRAVCRALP